MKFSLATIVLGLAAFSSAAILDTEGIRNAERDAVIVSRQNAGRPVPNGTCCVANTSLKQDACNVNGAAGRCVPGGQACGSRLSCVAQANLACDNNVIERGKSLCRAKVGNGFQDGARVIQNLNQAKVN
ncbi:uncharacterized protein B0I36DRAFT_386223 [Microdochium trichocladiopsis]|uniref:Uncharacterized protein n=1 Tax=Microdochium trichocladiopsis TaxID=1682393 RepID=A0A9P8XZ80_9PEZI|nr:uncharacterized protein B0I36DRAFT_386223 [Microdochium trichocladiopsis]KAH7025833.1 hypothetical protein B0I36DRAFT_386223 [Microdochium trichocladiopsis]